jgi:hypothetical protein
LSFDGSLSGGTKGTLVTEDQLPSYRTKCNTFMFFICLARRVITLVRSF